MSVNDELLCSFELLKPLDSSALKSHIKKGRNKRNSMLNSPVSLEPKIDNQAGTDSLLACTGFCTKLLICFPGKQLVEDSAFQENNEVATRVEFRVLWL